MNLEMAKAALERIRVATNAAAPANPEDVEPVIGYLGNTETLVLAALDLLAPSRNAFRSPQVERARKLLEQLLSDDLKQAVTSIEVHDLGLGGEMTSAQIRSIANELLRDRSGVWSISIRGSENSAMWEGQIKGPNGFAYEVNDIRPRHDANSIREFLARGLMRFDADRRV